MEYHSLVTKPTVEHRWPPFLLLSWPGTVATAAALCCQRGRYHTLPARENSEFKTQSLLNACSLTTSRKILSRHIVSWRLCVYAHVSNYMKLIKQKLFLSYLRDNSSPTCQWNTRHTLHALCKKQEQVDIFHTRQESSREKFFNLTLTHNPGGESRNRILLRAWNPSQLRF